MRLNERKRGFILPLAILLVVILTISGTAFMHHDYLERRMAMNSADNHGAFYLANAGNERAREAFKIPDALEWDAMLIGTGIPANQALCAGQPLCPDLSRGCAMPPPPFGPLVTASSAAPLPFDGQFTVGAYAVRAFNNVDDPGMGTDDTDQQLTLRACGTIRGEQKLLELTVVPISALDLINCQGDDPDPCPDVVNGSPTQQALPGREPESHPVLPSLPPLEDPFFPGTCNPANYYCIAGHFDFVTNPPQLLSGDITLTDNPVQASDVQIQNNTYYFTDGNVSVDHVNSGRHDIVVVGLGNIEVGTGVSLMTNSIVAGEGEVRLRGGVDFRAPLPYPAIISSQAVQADANVTIYGTVYSSGEVNLNPINVHGVVIGDPVEIQGSAVFDDDDNLAFYALTPGFTYPEDLKSTTPVAGTWRELQ